MVFSVVLAGKHWLCTVAMRIKIARHSLVRARLLFKSAGSPCTCDVAGNANCKTACSKVSTLLKGGGDGGFTELLEAGSIFLMESLAEVDGCKLKAASSTLLLSS